MAITARYTSKNGEYLAGVPARNLDEDDWSALDDEQRDAVKASGLYSIVGAEKTAAKPSPAGTVTPKDDGK